MLPYFFCSVKTKKVSKRYLLREKAASDSQLLLGCVYSASSCALNLTELGFESGPVGPGIAALSGSGFASSRLILPLISGLTANLYRPCYLLSPQTEHLPAPTRTTQLDCAHCLLEQAFTVIQPQTMPGTAPAPPLGLTSLHPLSL